jgi:hypothetical protein
LILHLSAYQEDACSRAPARDGRTIESRPANDSPTPSQSSVESRDPNPDSIAQAAYQRYEARGREDGHDVDDWLAAEREVSGGFASEGT